MKKEWLVKSFAFGVVVLFIGVSFQPTLAKDLPNKKSSMPVSNGNTFYVGGSGEGNYSQIQDAIDNASDGDIVFVYDDSSPYYENVAINKALFLCGENKQSTKIIGKVSLYSQNDVLITEFTINIITLERSSNITIINNDMTDENNGITIVDCSNFKIINNNITAQNDCGIEIITSHSKGTITGNTIISKSWSSPSYACISMRSVNDITISNNTFISLRDGIYDGIRLEIGEDNTIRNNYFIDTGLELWSGTYKNNIYENMVNGKPLIFLNGATDQTVDDAGQVFLVHCRKVTVCNLSISKVPCGITLYDTTQSTIRNNNISKCSKSIDCNYVNTNTFSQNMITGCYFYLSRSKRNIISENTLQNSGSGFSLYLSSSNIFNNNIIKSCNGIDVSLSWNNRIIKNQIISCSLGIDFEGSFFNIIEQNNFINNSKNAFFVSSLRNRWIRNYWGESTYLLYIIHGYLFSTFVFPDYFNYYFPLINFDWHPAQEPYDIGQ